MEPGDVAAAIQRLVNDESLTEVKVDLGNGFGVVLIKRENDHQIRMGKEREE